MQPSSFLVEFHGHLRENEWTSFLGSVSRAGADVQALPANRALLTCVKRSELQHVGYILFRVGIPNLCSLIETTGEAVAKASEYSSASQTSR